MSMLMLGLEKVVSEPQQHYRVDPAVQGQKRTKRIAACPESGDFEWSNNLIRMEPRAFLLAALSPRHGIT